ncbi:hypothetical protein ACT691_00955 [Vibrio metschnikovii]
MLNHEIFRVCEQSEWFCRLSRLNALIKFFLLWQLLVSLDWSGRIHNRRLFHFLVIGCNVGIYPVKIAILRDFSPIPSKVFLLLDIATLPQTLQLACLGDGRYYVVDQLALFLLKPLMATKAIVTFQNNTLGVGHRDQFGFWIKGFSLLVVGWLLRITIS